MHLKKLFSYKRIYLVPLAVFFAVILQILSFFPYFTEKYYSRGLYKIFCKTIGKISAAIPFSITNTLQLCLAISIVLFLVIITIKHIKSKKTNYVFINKRKKTTAHSIIATISALISMWYILFVLFCAPNYHRVSFSQQSGLYVKDSSVQELYAVCEDLVYNANSLRNNIDEDSRGVCVMPNYEILSQKATEYYSNLGKDYPALGGYITNAKQSLFSVIMSYMNMQGVYTAHFFEANINVDVVSYNIPATIMHEISHFKGFMREDEANFIGYLACIKSGDTNFMYSGTMLALIHATNALYNENPELYSELMDNLSSGVKKDLLANTEYWSNFKGVVFKTSTAVNDMYLKANNQSDGVKSYGAVVDLIIAYYRDNSLI